MFLPIQDALSLSIFIGDCGSLSFAMRIDENIKEHPIMNWKYDIKHVHNIYN